MITKINNSWITLAEQRNEVTVQRAFAGLHTMVGEPIEGLSEVKQCILYYHERELYPNGAVIKMELKNYILADLDYTEKQIDDILYYMDELKVLTGFVAQLGYDGIINPARETLENIDILPLSIENGYPLRRDTREKKIKV